METQPGRIPELPETFEAEFLHQRGMDAREAMAILGQFQFRSSGPEKEGAVFFEGERSDGSKIRIVVEKGDRYESPVQIKRQEEEAKKKAAEKGA